MIAVAHRQYEITAELTRTFLDRHLAGIVLFGEDAMTTTARFLLRDRGPEKAVEAFRLIAQVHASSARAHETFGDALKRIDRHHEAREAWTRALERTPADDAERRARLEGKLTQEGS